MDLLITFGKIPTLVSCLNTRGDEWNIASRGGGGRGICDTVWSASPVAHVILKGKKAAVWTYSPPPPRHPLHHWDLQQSGQGEGEQLAKSGRNPQVCVTPGKHFACILKLPPNAAAKWLALPYKPEPVCTSQSFFFFDIHRGRKRFQGCAVFRHTLVHTTSLLAKVMFWLSCWFDPVWMRFFIFFKKNVIINIDWDEILQLGAVTNESFRIVFPIGCSVNRLSIRHSPNSSPHLLFFFL